MPTEAHLVEIVGSSAATLQRDEKIVLQRGGVTRTLSLHDYREIYKIPGLYEKIFIEMFSGVSHTKVPSLLLRDLSNSGVSPEAIVALDLGAGVGLVGEQLQQGGITRIVGVDVWEEARSAALRDRPGVYADYLAADLGRADEADIGALSGFGFNCLICVSSLNVLPTFTWRRAYNLLDEGSHVAFNMLEGALRDDPAEGCRSGSNLLVKHMLECGILSEVSREAYVHRISAAGAPIRYVAVVGRKVRDIPAEMCSRHACSTW